MTGKLLTLDEARSDVAAAPGAARRARRRRRWHALDPPQRRQRTLEAIKRLLLRESQVQPLLVVFEDLHWIDSETQAPLDSLVESLPRPAVLLVNYRPEYQHGWSSKTYYRQLRVDPLPPESAEELLAGRSGASEPRQLKPLLIDRTEGNPFFLEESVRTLVETGTLAESGARIGWRSRPGDPGPGHGSGHSGGAHRSAPARGQAPAPVRRRGRHGRPVRAAAGHGRPDRGAAARAGHLQAAEFLYEASLFPELEYTFKHALTHEVAYGSLLRAATCAAPHIVDAIERLYADRLVEHLERLAHHALRGEMWDQAVAYLRQAGPRPRRVRPTARRIASSNRRSRPSSVCPRRGRRLSSAIDLRFDLRTALLRSVSSGELSELSP